jgi:hypothetical protein
MIEQFQGNQVDALASIDLYQEPALLIIINQGPGLLKVNPYPPGDGFRPVILALVKFGTVKVTFSGDFRRAIDRMKDVSFGSAGPSTGQPLDKELFGHPYVRNRN